MSRALLTAKLGGVATRGEPSGFLAVLGHDLRGPIAILNGQIQLMQRRLRREADRALDLRDLGRIAYQVDRLHAHLDLVLDAARILDDRLDMNPVRGDLTAAVRRVVAAIEPGVTRHTIVVDLPAEGLVGTWDHTLIGRALHAVVANAIRYSPRGGEVRVRAVRDGMMARLEVEDQGIGVPEADHDRIFECWRRGANAEDGGGAGLGLFVARAVVARHGGTLGFRPRPEGGTAFWITLPM
ncbi:MAG TPA: HAMP domain-containing sensor histidine kinase [Ktedonobacterales bacterium]